MVGGYKRLKLSDMSESKEFDKFSEVYLLESHRIASFKDWPFDDKSPCSIANMAGAGFYWSGNKREKDTATCFVCTKTLDGWESSDNPWEEHAKHAPQCMFVKFGRKEKDLIVEEFLHIFGAVVKNRIVQNLNEKKKELTRLANDEMNKFISSK